MEKMDNCDQLQHSKDEFKLWLKKFHEQLAIKNQSLKSALILKQQINKELKNNIETHINNSLDTSCLAVDVNPNKVQIQLETDVNQLKIKSEQLYKCKEAINAKVEDETKNMRNKFYEMITKDEVALKPYHEVEEALKELSLKTESCRKEQNAKKEIFIKKLKEREYCFNEIQQSLSMMKPFAQEMSLSVENYKKMFDVKLKSLKLKSLEEANDESGEAKELLADISNMKSQLHSQ